MLLNVTSDRCKEADSAYYLGVLDYFTAVKRCLLDVAEDEQDAIRICNRFESYLVEGRENRELPSSCASAISRFL